MKLIGLLVGAERVRASLPAREWCLKYSTNRGAWGRRLLTARPPLSGNWPRSLTVQVRAA
jgi:hypothetical protein